MKYLNRDISWLEFNARVLDEANRKGIPLQERVMFHSITRSNLAEHLCVRYPAAIELLHDNELEQQVKATLEHYLMLSDQFYKFNKEYGLIRQISTLSSEEKHWCEKIFKQDIFPALQPITIDQSRGMNNLKAGLYFFVITEDKKTDTEYINCIEIPKLLSRFIQVTDKPYCVTIEDMIQDNARYIFRDRKIVNCCAFTIARSAEVYLQPDEFLDPYQMILATLREREKSWVTYIEMSTSDKKLIKLLKNLLPITGNTILFSSPLIHLEDLKHIPGSVYDNKSKKREFAPYTTFPASSLFDHIRKEDQLVFHPFESFRASVVKLLEEAAVDPDVVSIKISLYRVSDNSKIIDALLKAADQGKIVTVLIELKARFDEHHNAEVSNILREGGVRLAYTNPDIKTHAKVMLITRKEKKGLRIYSHIGTGNYSESNAKQYTDYSYFTANQEIGYDLTRFFNLLTSNQGEFKSRKIIYAPYNMREEISKNIDREITRAKEGKPAFIMCKCNALTDDKIADKIISAAKAGVKVVLIVRGACIIPAMKNVEIHSIVGRFLEHSRVYVFGAKKNRRMYIGSADLMHRNMNLRNEIMILVEDVTIRQRILTHLDMYLTDTTNRRIMTDTGKYKLVKPKKGKKPYNCQERFIKEAKRLSTLV